METLKKNLEDLKIIIGTQKVHLENLFTDLKAEVDLAFTKKWNNENEEWLLIIDIIEIFRVNCFKKISNIDLKKIISIMFEKKIQMIEQQLNDSKSNDASNLLKIGTQIEEIQDEIKKNLS